jgi:hypothetical protein
MYNTAEEAAKIYDSAAKFYMKDFAYINFKNFPSKPMSCEEITKLKKIKKL